MLHVQVLRALPGCGKSHYGRKLLQHFVENEGGRGVIISADQFFEKEIPDPNGGESQTVYDFNPSLLGQAHSDCMFRFLRALAQRFNLIILDNTNTQEWEFRHYAAAATMMGYQVQLVEWHVDNLDVARICHARQSHGVPLSNWLQMWWRFERIPEYDGALTITKTPWLGGE